jgi:NADPH:quinone reductase-like Zn-dependent oxidoreductase
VIATAAARNHDFVAGLGAEEVLDYQAAPFESSVSGVDVVFDTVGGETLQRSWAVLNRSGRLVTIAADAESSIDPRTKAAFLLVEPNQYQLGAVGQLVASKRLRPVVDRVVPLARVADAYTGRLPRQGRGKVVMKIAAQAAEGALDDQQ